MSFSNPYEYMHGEFQDVTRVPLAAAGVDPAWIIDPNGVKIAGYQIELWDAETGGTRLLEGVDYSLVFLDSGKTAAEGIDIWAGYQVINVAYQGIPLYLTARIIGGYTKHNGGIIFDEAVGDQWVTKWDTGRMEIRGDISGSSAIDITHGALYRSDSITGYYAEPFISTPTTIVTTRLETFPTWNSKDFGNENNWAIQIIDVLSRVAGDYVSTFQATGRWK